MSAEAVVFCKHNFSLIQTVVASAYKQSAKQIITLSVIATMKVRKEQIQTPGTPSHFSLCRFPFSSSSPCIVLWNWVPYLTETSRCYIWQAEVAPRTWVKACLRLTLNRRVTHSRVPATKLMMFPSSALIWKMDMYNAEWKASLGARTQHWQPE